MHVGSYLMGVSTTLIVNGGTAILFGYYDAGWLCFFGVIVFITAMNCKGMNT